MKVRLEVLASTSIKSRKPCSRVVWLGQEQESLFLLDDKRVSVLYVPSGKTKKNVPKISHLLSSTSCLCPSPGGSFLVGVQSSGDVFIWHKDSDVLKSVCGLASLLQERELTLADGCTIFPSSDCSKLLLLLGNRHIFLWQRASDDLDPKSNVIPGFWSKVALPDHIWMAPHNTKAVAMDAVFTHREILGSCCQLSMVFNHKANLSVCSLFLMLDQSPDKGSEKKSVASAQWTSLEYPLKKIQEGCDPIDLRGAYVTRYSHDGLVLAVAVNQKSPMTTSILFVSPTTETVLVSGLRGCGLREARNKRGRQYWVSDMAWTSDNLFLSVILRNGSAGLLSRLGDPLALYSKGCSVELGPAYFLPFTPLISIQSDRSHSELHDKSLSVNSELDPMHQRFSASTHPRLPIVLFTDGYLVTIAQLPGELSPMLFMRDLVLESSAHLKQIADTQRLDLTVANAYNLPASDLENVKGAKKHSSAPPRGGNHYTFEEPSISLNDTMDSEVSFALGDGDKSARVGAGAVQNASSGKIIFGEPEVMLLTEDWSLQGQGNSTMKALELAKLNLFNVWRLAVSSSEAWSPNHDTIVKHAVLNVVKLFSLVLDCQHIREMLEVESAPKATSQSSVQTPSLFKVITMYRQLLDLLQFDSQHRRLLPSVVRLSHKSVALVLESLGLAQSDPRIKTLTGCFTLLKFTEKSLISTYVSLPKAIHAKGLTRQGVLGHGEHQMSLGPGDTLHSDTQMAQRLMDSWKMLYKKVADFVAGHDVKAADLRQGQALMSAIQQSLVELDADVPKITVKNVSKGEKFSLDGKHTMAMGVWKQQLEQFHEEGNVKNAAKLFHSLLYTYILRNDLLSAISFVDNLILKANPHVVDGLDPNTQAQHSDLQPSLMTFVTSTLKSQAMQEPDMVPCIRDRSIRQVVQTMSRFMAAYFSNQSIFIFPPHNPTPLPAVHIETSIANSHIIPKYHEDLASTVRHQKLGGVWTVERTLEYLLLSGLVCEAAWFADRMGDWKAAFQLSVSHILHRKLAPTVYIGMKKPLSLPDWLTPESIMKRKLECLVKDDVELSENSSDLSHLTQLLQEISLAGVMGFVEVGCWLMEALVDKLKSVVKQLPPLVTKDFYLPAPPLYLPQPQHTGQLRHSLEAAEEVKLRQRASSIIQVAICAMQASNLAIPSACWYVQALNQIQRKATQFKATTEPCCLDLPDALYRYLDSQSDFPEPCDDASVQTVQSTFRDLCSLIWLLHARDKLSQALRSREKFLNLGLDVESSDKWLKECFVTLQWAVHLIPFSHFLSDEANIYKVVLSLLLELPHTEDTADILAEHTYAFDNLHPEVQERLERTLSAWQGIVLVPEADGRSVGDSLDLEDEGGRKSVTFLGASPRGKSLSAYFHKQCLLMDRVIKKKTKCFGDYEEFLFDSSASVDESAELCVGSRPFETKKSFFEFLDQFFSIAFGRMFETMAGKDRLACLPFLRVFAKDIVDREMTFFVERVSRGHFPRPGLSILSAPPGGVPGGRTGAVATPSRERAVPGRTSGRVVSVEGEIPAVAGPSSQPVGLFRGKSAVEVSPERSHATVKRYESDPGPNREEDSEASAIDRSHPNLTGIASRFAHSEESLYRSHAATEQDKGSWSLVVNFGKRYTSLQQMVEWLEVWGNKVHGFHMDHLLDVAPKMKIQIPAQLIILSLWLLEHKYKHTNGRLDRRAHRPAVGKRGRRLSRSPARRQSPSPTNSLPRTPNRNPTTAHQLRRSMTPPIQRLSGSRDVSLSGSPDDLPDGIPGDAMRLSLQASSLEQDQIIDAYTQVLDGPEDSSSIGVSSLASDELDGDLKTTLNAIRNTNTPTKDNSSLNKVVFPKDESPSRGGPVPKEASTPVKESGITRDHRVRSSQSSPPPPSFMGRQSPSQAQASLRSARPMEAGNQLGEGLAGQLQGIIRDELRKIMQVQHQSVLAMMGALDGISPSDMMSHTPLPPRHKSPRSSPAKENRPNPPKQQQHQQRWSEDDEVFEVEDAAIAESLPRHGQPRRRARGGEENMRHTLSELQNLQIETRPVNQGPSKSRNANNTGRQLLSFSPPSYQEEIRARTSSAFGASPRQNEGQSTDFRLPYLPRQAWTQETATPHPVVGQDPAQRMPLLQIHQQSQAEDGPFRNLNRFLSQIPPPPPPPHPASFGPPSPSYRPFSFSLPTVPYPSSQHQHQQQQATRPALHFLLQAPPPYEHHRPVLPFVNPGGQSSGAGMTGFPLLRFQSPESASYPGNKTADGTRERLLNEFNAMARQGRDQSHRETVERVDRDNQDVMEESVRSTHSEGRAGPSQEVDGGELDGDLEDTQEGLTSMASGPTRPSVADAATSDTQLNNGFAMQRGVFDSYLKLGEQLVGPEVNATNAAFQMKMAQAMQREMERRIRTKVDFATMTQEQVDAAMLTDPAMEVVRTAEAATSITRDTGSDPIQEAVDAHNLKRHNNLLPPDIFMGLRFDHQEASSAPTQQSERARSFLNVVDIRSSAVLKDIPERSQEPRPHDSQQMMDSALLTSQQTAQQIGDLEETLRQKLEPSAKARTGYDSLTVKLFNDLKPGQRDSLSVAVLPRSSQSQPKSAMIRRLRDMSDQIKAIDDMSRNIERDFKSSHLLLDTIQDVNASIHISRSPSPDRTRNRRHKDYKELRYSLEDEEIPDDRSSMSGTPVPKMSSHSPQASARSARSRSTLASHSAGTLTASGSAMTDLISEVLAQEGVDMQAAGFSQEMAQALEMDAKDYLKASHKPGLPLSPRDKLVNLNKAEEMRKKKSEEERENLRLWMTDKFRERQDRYLQRRRDFIEREPKPFKSQSVSPSMANLKSLNQDLSDKRRHLASEFMSQRLAEAESLMGSIMGDRPELLSEAAGDNSLSPSRRSPGRSPKRLRSPSRLDQKSETRASRPRSRRTVNADTWTRHTSPGQPESLSPVRLDSSPIKGILKSSSGRDIQGMDSDLLLDRRLLESITEGSVSVDSSADLINYARAVLEMDQTPGASLDSLFQQAPQPDARKPKLQQPRQRQPPPPPPQPKVKAKPLTSKVRLQRPEVTRKWKEMNAQRRAQDEELARRVQQEEYNKVAAETSQHEKEKIYDSKKMPGSSPRHTVTVPRRVKTYAERLQEMKPSQKTFSPSVTRPPGSSRTVSSHTFRTNSSSKRQAPPHKPQTYVQQLQGLSAKAASQPARRASKKSPIKTRTFMKSHGPIHKPQTYTEQLQSLNPHPLREQSRNTLAGLSDQPSSSSRQPARARPYRDPYAQMDYEELASVLSDWEMNDDIKNIIYGGSTPSNSVTFMTEGADLTLSGKHRPMTAPSEGQSDYFDVVMNEDVPFRDYEGDYSASVDISEIQKIADAASVRSDSVVSVIDWDRIDDLIRDV